MFKPMLLAVSAVLILGFAPAPKPQRAVPPPPQDCRDDRGVDRCSAEQQRRVRDLFGVASIEAHRDAGDQVRRAFYVSGYGRDVVAIVFIRPKGGDPTLRVHFPRGDDGTRPEPLQAPVPYGVWEDVIRRSSHFDEQLKRLPEPPLSPGEISFCLHSWVFTVEATDPAMGEHQPATLRRKTEDACDNGLVEAYAGELRHAAVPLLRHCAKLDRAKHRNEADLLSSCGLLRGDRLAAAEVMNRLYALEIERPEEAASLQDLFVHDARIDWAGEPFAAPGGAAKTWAAKMTDGGRALLYWDYVEGLTADRVRFVGLLSRSLEGDDGSLTARVEQTWTRNGGVFQIEQAKVGRFEPEPTAAEGGK